ncbi:MAG: TadE/TadG family type IV pilus assembly protein [Rhodocyclaceae bacterium]|nr:TadE/TadG family type IV pilus assembly protein [Rhodocyclaceae bacterium]
MKTSDNISRFPRWRESGAIVVEMALVVTVLLLVAAGIVEFGRIFWYYNALDKATRNAARYMSSVSRLDMQDSAKAAAAAATARTLVLTAVADNNLSPALAAANVTVSCDGVDCSGTAPTNVSVGIANFQVTPGNWFPFVTVAGGSYGSITLAPATTMRYMN